METPPDFHSIVIAICQNLNLKFIKELGDGSYKKVYKVLGDGSYYALKVIKSTDYSPRQEREIRAIQKCDHTSIAKIIDYGQQEFNSKSYQYIIEELLDGGTLTDLLNRKGKLAAKNSIKLGRELIFSIEHLHDRNMVHRDIKPDNIMFRKDSNKPVLVDFSIVRDLSEVSITESWLGRGPGTPYYASPEQLNNEKQLIDWRTDQFSLGVVISIAVTGKHPFQKRDDSTSPREVVERVTNREGRDDENLKNYIKLGLTCLIKMTSPWPVQRYRTPELLLSSWNNQKVN